MSAIGRLGAVALLFGLLPAFAWGRERPDFPEPERLRPAVAFWQRVYLESTTDGGFLHDSENLGVVYELIRFEGAQGRTRERLINGARGQWQDALERMARGASPRTEDENRVYRELEIALGRVPRAGDLRAASDRIRFQLGQRDKFRAGLIRSGAYEDEMRAAFRKAGLPEDLAYLPHVESSFNTKAYSKYGAAGAWQFMRSTGQLYMKVNYEIDERLDPMVSTRAATRLLGENYAALQSWPLALTAYNHGRGGMLRAKAQHGDDIAVIVERYKGRTFGFASRNFYAQFLAARKIVKSYTAYFGDLERDRPTVVDEITLPFYADVDDLRRHLGVSPDVVRDYNPALRNPIFTAGKRIPKGYTLRLPAGTTAGESARTWLAAIPASKRHDDQYRSRYYEVRRGDTLGKIARRNGVSVGELVAVNDLKPKSRIHPGTVLQLPDRRRRGAPVEDEGPSFELIRTANAAAQTQRAMPTPPRPRKRAEVVETAEAAPSPAVEVANAAVVPSTSAELPLEPTAPIADRADPAAVEPAPIADPATDAEAVVAEIAATAERTESAPAAASETAAPGRLEPVAQLSEDSPWRRIKGNAIVVDADETIGHYADWLEVSTTRLRSLNKIRKGGSIRMGQRIKLDFKRISAETFLQRRIEYHKGIAEDFFGSYEVISVKEHRVRPGETIWNISTRTYGVPTWLIHRYNPDADLTRLTPGSKLVIPVVQEVTASAN